MPRHNISESPCRRWGPVLWLSVLLISAATASPLQAQFWTLSGSVQDETGAPLPFIDLDLFPAGSGGAILITGDTTGPLGTYVVTVLETIPAGMYDITFTPIDLLSHYFPAVHTQFLAGSTSIPTITLQSGWWVTGTVVDDTGTPLPGMDTQFFDSTGTLIATTMDFTDDFGVFNVLVPPDVYDIRVRPLMGEALVPVTMFDRPVFQDMDLGVITLHDGYHLTGTVHDSSGLPVANGDIDVRDPVTRALIDTPGDSTSPTGAFDVLVPVGTWEVEIDPPTGTTLVSALEIVTVTASPTPTSMGIVVLADGVVVSGTTQDGAGAPVPEVDLDFLISATGIEIPTAHDNADATGAFAVVVPPDTYDVIFRPPFPTGLAPLTVASVSALTSTSMGAVTLPAGFALTGTVTDGVLPLEGVEVTLQDSATGTPVYTFGNDTDFFGQYAIRQVSGTYDVIFTPPIGSGLSTFVQQAVALTSDTVLDVSLGVSTTVVVDGTVVSSTGSPVADVDIDLIVSATGASVPLVGDVTGADGVFSFDVSPDTYDARFRPPYSSGLAPVEIPSVDASAGHSFGPVVLPVGVALTGTVISGGSPVADVEVTVAETGTGAPVFVFGNTTDLLGAYALRVASGTYDVSFTPPAGSGLPTHVESGVVLTTDTALDVTLGGGGGATFVRGDANGDGNVDIADAVQILDVLFSGGGPFACPDAADANDDGTNDISDAIFVLSFLFSGGSDPAPPFPSPGEDPTPDGLTGCL